jgi:hypothetical protein
MNALLCSTKRPRMGKRGVTYGLDRQIQSALLLTQFVAGVISLIGGFWGDPIPYGVFS